MSECRKVDLFKCYLEFIQTLSQIMMIMTIIYCWIMGGKLNSDNAKFLIIITKLPELSREGFPDGVAGEARYI